MTIKTIFYCNICEREMPDAGASFMLRKHGVTVTASVITWGIKDKRVATAHGHDFTMAPRECNHICHRCLLDICRTGEIDPNGWSRAERAELKIVEKGYAKV